jgi:catechol 2,3-dioxygenase-like lactoylglutathione lyase family enzyme
MIKPSLDSIPGTISKPHANGAAGLRDGILVVLSGIFRLVHNPGTARAESVAFVHITLATRDVRRSSEFFQQTLGWQPIARPGNINQTATWLAIAPGEELHLIEVADFAPSPFEREFGRHVAVTFPRGEFPQLKARLQAHGAAIIEPIRETPFARFFFRDPNGYVFEVVEENHHEPRPIG